MQSGGLQVTMIFEKKNEIRRNPHNVSLTAER